MEKHLYILHGKVNSPKYDNLNSRNYACVEAHSFTEARILYGEMFHNLDVMTSCDFEIKTIDDIQRVKRHCEIEGIQLVDLFRRQIRVVDGVAYIRMPVEMWFDKITEEQLLATDIFNGIKQEPCGIVYFTASRVTNVDIVQVTCLVEKEYNASRYTVFPVERQVLGYNKENVKKRLDALPEFKHLIFYMDMNITLNEVSDILSLSDNIEKFYLHHNGGLLEIKGNSSCAPELMIRPTTMVTYPLKRDEKP